MGDGVVRGWLIVFLWLGCFPASATSYLDQKAGEVFEDVYRRLGIDLPESVVHDPMIWRTLEVLKREPCDQKALGDFTILLDRAGYRREVALSQYNFVKHCGEPARLLHRAIDQFLKLSDYNMALEVSDDFVRRLPTASDAHYLRGVAQYRLGDYRRAITDFANAIELFGPDRREISSVVFTRMADAYAKLGRHCEAASTMSTWVAIDSVRRDNSRGQKLVDDYLHQGDCAPSEFRKERFALHGTRVVVARGTINGIKGTFIIDTGASYVTVKKDFADRAKIAYANGGDIVLHTAKGQARGKLARADRITLGKLQAGAVPVVVQDDSARSYGAKVDGLLGMSFLSRFELQLSGGFMEIRTRRQK